MSPGTVMSPAQVVARQLELYNARDLDPFMALWAEDARLFEHPATLLADGKAAIRERHALRFAEPNLHARLVSRVEIGNKVIDQEVVTRTFPEGPGTLEVVAIYEVVGEHIVASWVMLGRKVLD